MADLPTRRGRFLGALLLLLVLGAGGAFAVYWYAMRDGTPPSRVLVVVAADPPPFAMATRTGIARKLASLGFDLVEPPAGTPAPRPDVDWDGAVAAADAAGAHYVIYARVRLDEERPGLTEAMGFVVVEVTGRVGSVDPDEAEPRDLPSYTFASEGRGVGGALDGTVPKIAEAYGHAAAGELVRMPALAERLAAPERMSPDEANSMAEALTRLAGQTRSRERYDEVCIETTVDTTIDDERGPAAITCLGLDCGERHIYGATDDGSAMLIHEEPAAAYIPFASSPAPRNAEVVERLLLAPVGADEQQEPRIIASADNFIGYGSMSADASRVAFIEQAQRRFGLVIVEVASGERRVLRVLEQPRMLEQVRLSPDGRWVAIHQKAFARAHSELHVLSVDGEEDTLVSRRTRVGRWVTAPLRPGEEATLLVAFDGTESYAGSPRPALFDPMRPTDIVDLDVGDHVVRQVAGSHEGRLVLIGSQPGSIDTCEIGLRDPSSGEVTWQPMAVCVEDARVAATGELTGAAVLSDEGDPEPSDTEAIVMDLETGQTTVHTRNRIRERYVRLVGEMLLFERPIASQFPAVHPNAVCMTAREVDSVTP